MESDPLQTSTPELGFEPVTLYIIASTITTKQAGVLHCYVPLESFSFQNIKSKQTGAYVALPMYAAVNCRFGWTDFRSKI